MPNRSKRVVVTGMGVLSSIGNSIDEYALNLKNGVSGVAPVTLFDTNGLRVHIACEIKDLPAVNFPYSYRALDMIHISAVQAVKDSKICFKDEDPYRIGSVFGLSQGSIESLKVIFRKIITEKDISGLKPEQLVANTAYGPAKAIASYYDLKGPSLTVSTACSSSLNSVMIASDLIGNGLSEICFTGGAEDLFDIAYYGFHSLRGLAEKKCQPFDKNRSGLLLGEGAGILILEELEHALKRKAMIYAEILGYGNSSDAYHETSPDPSGRGAALAMKAALEDAHLRTDAVEYINAHGTGTQQNDEMETKAIKGAFGENAYEIPVSSTKSMTGHALGAAGIIEIIACILAMRGSFIPPTINYETPDPACDLDYVPNRSRPKTFDISMSNNFAFAGNNSSIIIKKWKTK
ncbi:MAG: beta-ketoacyl-[acyl-carrier-protein] synthase family protein [Candidatus Saganbacteria bacterium]|nr:beta-ketoacyl-[acyl-carrier-protein] synthase family protein [Candidatus Saganbacteria bacterium]